MMYLLKSRDKSITINVNVYHRLLSVAKQRYLAPHISRDPRVTSGEIQTLLNIPIQDSVLASYLFHPKFVDDELARMMGCHCTILENTVPQTFEEINQYCRDLKYIFPNYSLKYIQRQLPKMSEFFGVDSFTYQIKGLVYDKHACATDPDALNDDNDDDDDCLPF